MQPRPVLDDMVSRRLNTMFQLAYDLLRAATRSVSVEDGTWLRVEPTLDIPIARLRRAPMIAVLLAIACGDRTPPPDYDVSCDYVECETADIVRRFNGEPGVVYCAWGDLDGDFVFMKFESHFDECFEITEKYVDGWP